MKQPEFLNNNVYHIYNRGVEKRNIFLDEKDYFRFIYNLFEFNDKKPAENLYYKQTALQSYEVKPRKIEPRDLLVEILVFCLMPNHFHLLLRQKQNNGITDFMQKLGTGYTMFFNKKHERNGTLFQSTFRAILINKEPHFFYLPYYIHLNPLDLIEPKWREGEIKDYQKSVSFLENYRWSSHLDYLGQKNFPSVTQREFLFEYFRNSNQYKQSIEHWLRKIHLGVVQELNLE